MTLHHLHLDSPLLRPLVDEYVRTDGHRKRLVRRVGGPRAEVEAVGIEQPVGHPIPTILERFRGHVSTKTRPKNTSKTRYRTFL